MAVTSDRFRARFPEFELLPEATLQEYLRSAEAQIDAAVWSVLADEGVLYLAASLLALTPYGQQAKLADASGKSTYRSRYDELVGFVSLGVCRVAGETFR